MTVAFARFHRDAVETQDFFKIQAFSKLFEVYPSHTTSFDKILNVQIYWIHLFVASHMKRRRVELTAEQEYDGVYIVEI
jgi:hypothetical protein